MSATAFVTASTSRVSPPSSAAWRRAANTNAGRLKPPCSKRWVRKRCGMPDPTGPSLPDFGSLDRGQFSYLPVVPGRLEFAAEVRRRILTDRPDIVAVELPQTLEDVYLDAVRRLPQISVIFYNDTTLGNNPESAYQPRADDDRSVYVPVEPA